MNCPQCSSPGPLFWTSRGKLCRSCGEGKFLQLAPSPRQQRRFSLAFSLTGIAEIFLLPLALPGFAAASLLLAARLREPLFWRMFAGLITAFVFWVFLLPPFFEDPRFGSMILLFLFASLLLFFQLGPAFIFSRNLLLRGRGLAAGMQLASALALTGLSLLAPLLLFLFVP